MGDLFGGSKSTSSSTTPTSFQSLPGFGQDAYQQAVTGIQGLSTNDPGIYAPSGYTGQQNQALQLADQGPTYVTPDSFGANLNTFMNPYNNDVIKGVNDQILLATKGLLNDNGSAATAAGAFGGTRQGVTDAQTNKDALTQIGNTDAQLLQTGFDTASNNALNAINTNNNLQNNQINTLNTLGTQLQNQNTAVQQTPLTALQGLLTAAQGLPTGGGTVSQSKSVQNANIAGTLLGNGGVGGASQGIGSALSALALMSDRRLKKNIKLVGEANGHNIYQFEYKNHTGRYEGVMADEVLDKRPDAIGHVHGYMSVNYHKLGLQMRRVA